MKYIIYVVFACVYDIIIIINKSRNRKIGARLRGRQFGGAVGFITTS
jgi:hypothetical protein